MDKFIDALKKGFSIVASETKKISKTVAGKTNTLVDVTKLNIALSDTEKKISAIYEKIGKTVYEKYSEGAPVTDAFSDLCEEIDAFIVEQESLKAQIAELKNTVSCPECGQNNDKNSVFCSKCGAKLTQDSVENEDNVIEVTDIEDDE